MNIQNDINAYAAMEQNLKSELQEWMGALNFTSAAKEKMLKMIKFKIYNTTMYTNTRGGGRQGSCVKQNLQYAYVLQLNPMYKNVRVKLIHFENPNLFHVFIVADVAFDIEGGGSYDVPMQFDKANGKWKVQPLQAYTEPFTNPNFTNVSQRILAQEDVTAAKQEGEDLKTYQQRLMNLVWGSDLYKRHYRERYNDILTDEKVASIIRQAMAQTSYQLKF